MVTLKCLECSKEFEAQRSSAKFCSTKCRVDYNRRSVEDEKDLQKAASAISINAALKQIEKEEETTFQGFVELVNPKSEAVLLKEIVTPESVNQARTEIENHTKLTLPKAKGIMLGAEYLADVPKTTFQKLLIEFNSLIDEQPPIKQVEGKLYELIEKSQHPDLNARQSEAIRERCINYLTGQYGKKKQS